MARKTGAITIRDVSQLAGVSPATVSKVLNNSSEIPELTRERVLEAVRTLEFRPNSIARSLRVQRTRTLGLITDDIEAVFTTSLMPGVEEAASGEGFSVFLCNSYGRPEREREHLELLLDKQVDAVILLSGFRVRERGAPAVPLGGVPVLYLYQYTHAIAAPSIVPDDRGGGLLGTSHLLAAGRRRIGFINGPAKYEATYARLAGYQAALAAAGLPFDPTLWCPARSCSWEARACWYEPINIAAAERSLRRPLLSHLVQKQPTFLGMECISKAWQSDLALLHSLFSILHLH